MDTRSSLGDILHTSSQSENSAHHSPPSAPDYGKNTTSTQVVGYPTATDQSDQKRPSDNASSTTLSRSTTSGAYRILNYNASTNPTQHLTDCWTQWTSFWSSSANSISVLHLGVAFPITLTSTVLETIRRVEWLNSIVLTTTTQTLVDNGYVFSTVISTLSAPTTFDSTSKYPWITGTDSIYTLSDISQYVSEEGVTVTYTNHPTPPTCVLPSVVPQCQAQWNTWLSIQLTTFEDPPFNCSTTWDDNGVFTSTYPDISKCAADKSWRAASASLAAVRGSPSPACSLAHINPTQCSDLRSLYLSSWMSSAIYDPLGGGQLYHPSMTDIGFQPTKVTGLNGSVTNSNYWPSASLLGPSCTLGCGACAITGDTVQLFYWPVSKTQETMNHTKRDYWPITAWTLNTTFVSPTVYVYYSKIYAANSCGRPVGQTYYSKFVPITNTDELSSVWASVDMTKVVLDWGEYKADVPSSTARFNFTDLNSPVPISIYERQPWCVSWSTSRMQFINPEGETNFNNDFHSTCPQTQPYDPILVVPLQSIQMIDPLWSTCSFDLR